MSADLLQEARRRLDAGDPRAARELAAQALEASRTSGSPETRQRAAHLLGEALFDMGDIAEARVLVGEALRLSQAGEDPEALGADLNLLGVIELTEERFDEAVFLLRRSYDLRAQAVGADSSGAVESLNNLAGALWRVGEQDEALALHEDALRRCELAFGENHHRTAETLIALAVKLGTRPDSRARSRALFERALASADAAHGGDSPLVGRALANVAVARMNDDDLDSVGPLLERALALHERHHGPESRWTSHVVHAQGLHAYHQGRFDDARAAFERALVVRMRQLGPEHRETISAAKELWGVLLAMAERDPEPSANDMEDEARALERVCVALDPGLEGAGRRAGGVDRAEAAEQLRRIVERIESRTGS